jgi:2-C-methyl-D-erythritol 2,4-cyclodiphosphate synthase
MNRIGLGQDLHRLVRGRPFILGGVEIPFNKGEAGHSDGDVLAHAITDAILGASGLADIGELYPNSDPVWKDANSMNMLRSAFSKVTEAGWRLAGLDCVIICEKPKILPFRGLIRESIAGALGVSAEKIFLKGKTAEGLGPVGRGKAVEALAVCLLER